LNFDSPSLHTPHFICGQWLLFALSRFARYSLGGSLYHGRRTHMVCWVILYLNSPRTAVPAHARRIFFWQGVFLPSMRSPFATQRCLFQLASPISSPSSTTLRRLALRMISCPQFLVWGLKPSIGIKYANHDCGLPTNYGHHAAPALCVCALQEGLHGLGAHCLSYNGSTRCPTIFPAPPTLGATFNRTLLHLAGETISTEV
jgi:hypothetical protein